MSWPLLEILEMSKQDDGAAVTAPADEKSTQAENELICEKLIGWKRICRSPDNGSQVWDNSYCGRTTPTFTDWQGAGMILDALQAKVGHYSVCCRTPGWFLDGYIPTVEGYQKTGPLAIRAAALSYLRSLER